MALPNEPAGPLAALEYRDFRLLWLGQTLSMVGTRMQGAALSWHVYDLTGSALALGKLGLTRAASLMLFALLGGVLADAVDRRRLMLFSQSVLGLLAAGIGCWTLLGMRQVWPLYALTALTTIVGVLDGPARQSLIPSLVPRERLRNAVTLNSITSQLASVAGPALLGLVLARGNVGFAYCFNALSFVTVIAALLLMRREALEEPVERPKVSLQSALEGLHFVRGSRILISLMLLDFLATFWCSANTLLPIYADRILHVGKVGYGWLSAAASVGALLGALGMALVPRVERQGLVVLGAVFAFGLFTVLFGASDRFWLCFLALAGTGAADTVSTVLRQTIRQLVTPDALRGRMTSVNMIFFQGGPQLGEWEAGAVASLVSVPFAVVSGGLACLLTVILVGWRAPWLVHYRQDEMERTQP